ncbi:MAG: type IV pilus modification protein PilV [Candidatus Thiodiazotropha sp.]|jgi:type IV pilus assembly protein PilV
MRVHKFSLTRHSCRGMTMIEVLIAAVVIGVGLLGVAALQVTALRDANDANYRSRAADISSSLADRIRANPTVLDTYAPTPDVTYTTADTIVANNCTMIPGNATPATNCNPADMATFDLASTLDLVREEFPSGSELIITCPNGCSATDVMQITIRWPTQEMDAANDPVFQETMSPIIPGSVVKKPGEV